MRELLKDLNYGSKVIKQTLGQVIWFWFKYVLAIGICGLVIGISALFYYTPQFPKLLTEKVPEVQFTIKNGKLTTNQQLPFKWDDGRMFVYIDENKIILSDSKGENNEIKFADIKEEVKFDKNMIVKWSTENKLWLLGVGLAILFSLILVLGIFYLLWQTIMFLVWSLGFWIFSFILKKKLGYLDIIKLVITASVIPLFISTLNIVFQDRILNILSFGILVFYCGIWIYHLPSGKK